MAWVLVALLLLPAGVWTADTDYGMVQPAEIFAVRGGSVQIPFRFFHTWELPSDPKINLLWRWKDFYGKFIYNMSSGFVHTHFKNRLVLNYTKNGKWGFLSISNLRQGDSTTYYCRVQLNTKDYGLQAWQSILGTKLIVTEAIKTTTQTKTTSERSTSVASEVTSASITVSESQPLNLGAFVGVVVATALCKTGVLGLVVFLRWRRKGPSTEPYTAPR
ncbi:paired immunoglobulin-like type 2 receptor alpha [Thomomys bottae]